MDATLPAVARECNRADAVIVRIPTDEEVPGVTMAKLHKMLREAGPHQAVCSSASIHTRRIHTLQAVSP